MDMRVEVCLKEADALLEKKSYEEAYDLILRELGHNGTNPALLAMMGRLLYYMKNYHKAYEYYRQALYFEPDNKMAAAGILILSAYGSVSESLNALFGVIKNDCSIDGYLARNAFYLQSNNIKAAAQEMRLAYDKYASNEEVLLTYIDVLSMNRIEDPCIELLLSEGKKRFNDIEFLKRELLYLYKVERYDKCLDECKKLAELYPDTELYVTAENLIEKITAFKQEKENALKSKEISQNALSGPKNSDQSIHVEEPEMTPEEAENELNELIGLETIKEEIFRIKKKIIFDKRRKDSLGIDYEDQDVYHFIFSGNPGTGKTTVARLFAQILHGVGFLEKGQLVEVDRGDLVGEYQGHTAVKTKEAVKKALGGVLFVDEAYALLNGEFDDFGHEAINTLVKSMDDHRHELVVILAGYKDEMYNLIRSNVGLESRFTRFINFPDYTEDELLLIAKVMAKKQHYSFTSDGEIAFREKISRKKVNKKFGNARAVRNLMSDAYIEKAVNYDPEQCSVEYMTLLTPEDFGIDLSADSALKTKDIFAKLDKLIGLKDVKYEIKSTATIVDYLKTEISEGHNTYYDTVSNLNMCFVGNPGTGKTTIARIYAELLVSIGISKTGELIEVTREDLVGKYGGETALKTKEVCERAYGGVLFIDEAYSLYNSEFDGLGREAIATLVKQMEDNREKMIVIFAGYAKEMCRFFESNTGLKSRIIKTIKFPDYSADELKSIFQCLADERNIIIDPPAELKMKEIIDDLYVSRSAQFGNAREMRNLFDTVWKNMVNRVQTNELTGDERRTFKKEDFEYVS